jgi:hypothetical protein
MSGPLKSFNDRSTNAVCPLVTTFHEASYHSTDSSWAFLKLLDCTPAHAHAIHAAPTLRRCLMLLDEESQSVDNYYPLA